MSPKPPFVIPNPNFWLTLFTLILLTSFSPFPVDSRPSASVDDHANHENADTATQQWEDINNNNSQEQTVTEMKTSVEQEVQEEPDDVDSEPSDVEDYPQHDMPAASANDAAYNGGRKGEGRRSKSLRQSGKGGRRDDTDGTPEDSNNPDVANRTVSHSSAPSSNENDSKATQQLMRLNQEIDHADSDRQERLKEIMKLVTIYRSKSLALNPRPPNGSNDGDLLLNLNFFHPSALDAYPMLSRSFHPSCSLPNNTNVKLWVDGYSMNLLFNLTYPPQQNTTVTIIAATLRLYKFSQGNHTLKAHSRKPAGVSSPNPDNENEQDKQEPDKDAPGVMETPEPTATTATVMTDDDKQLRVSVYWYTQPLKKNKGKRKLLDSRMLPIYGKNGWIEFNVGSAAGQWYQPGKNFGLVVEVENEDGQLLKASDYFTAMNCSEASTARPLPGVLLQTAQSQMESSYAPSGTGLDISRIMASLPDSTYTNPISRIFPDNGRKKKETDHKEEDAARRVPISPYVYTFLFPVIDMCTVQVPAQEATNAAFVHNAQHLLTQLMAACRTTNMHNYADVVLMHETPNYRPQAQPVTEETNTTSTTDVNNLNVSHTHREGHKKDQCRNILQAVRLALPEELSPSMLDSLCSIKIRHMRHHLDDKHRQRNESSNEETEKDTNRRVTDEENERESEEVKEQETWTEENGREFDEKITFQEDIRSEDPLDSGVIPERDSDR